MIGNRRAKAVLVAKVGLAVAAALGAAAGWGAQAAAWKMPDQAKAPVATRPWTLVKGAAPSLIPGGQWRMVWHDEFDGTKLDTSKWCYRTNFWGMDAYWFARPEDNAVEVANGVARLKIVKRANGQLCSPQLQTGRLIWDDLGRNPDKNGLWPFPKREPSLFEHTFGYYECRCRLQRKKGWWTAFWMQAPGSGATLNPRDSGIEQDIMESFFPGEIITHAFHTRGYGADYKGFNAYRMPIDQVDCEKNPVWRLDPNEFHTFGFLWEEDGYTVFIDGRRSGMKVGQGAGEAVSHVPEFILVSTELKMFRANRGKGKADPDLAAAYAAGDDFVIDHVRVFDRVDVPGPQWARGEFHARDLTPLKGEKRLPGGIAAVTADKIPLLSIVVNDRNRLNVRAAEYLQTIIYETAGVKPAIWRETAKRPALAGPAFYVGDDLEMVRRVSDLPKPDVENDAFAVAVRNGSYYFVGRAFYGVYDFCERVLGSREYFDAKQGGRCVLKTKGLLLPMIEWGDKPVFLKRQSYPYHHLPWCSSQKDGAAPHKPAALHVHSSVAAAWQTNHNWMVEDPTVYAMNVDGKRGGDLCYGNPKTLEMYQEAIARAIAAKGRGKGMGFIDMGTKSVTLSQGDCGVNCHCDFCKKLQRPDLAPSGDGSPVIWSFFAKNLAGWLKQKYPDWRLVILPYINTCDVPPGLDLTAEGNVEAMLCTMPGLAMLKNPATKKHEEDLIRAWHKVTGNRVINWHYSCWPAEFTVAPYLYGEQIKSHYKGLTNELVGTYINGPAEPMSRHALNLLVWMRCLWNPAIDVNGVYDGFAKRMFGRAEKPMRRLIKMQQDGWNRPWRSNNCSNKNIYEIAYPTNAVAAMKALFAEAHALAKDAPEDERRIAWYEKGFAQFFKESAEHADGSAFAPLVMKKAEQPKIDGKLDDACWRIAEGLKMVRSQDLKEPTPTYQTEVKAVWNEKGVTFGFKCWEKRMDLVQTKAAPGSFGNETFDIFLDASGGGEGMYAQVVLDARNTITRYQYGAALKGELGLRSAFDINPRNDYWTAEFYVPYTYFAKYPNAQIPTTSAGGRFWCGNISRWRIGGHGIPKKDRPAGEKLEMQRLWTRGNWWNSDPGAFGVMKFVE